MKRSIAYTSSWLHTFLLSCILAAVIAFVLIFLQPFDSYTSQISHKNLKLLGYGLCIIFPINFLHIIEEAWFKFTKGKWYLYQEIITLTFGFLLISICSFFYNVFVVNDIPFESRFMLGWVVNFGLPFIPVFIPLWAYLRFRFSKITIKTFEGKSEKEISIEGNNQNEIIKFKESQFVMAQAQANYVDIHFLSENQLHKEMIRYTISGILDVIPSVQQIHRSYLVNPAMITDLNGNTRKGTVKLKYIEEEIPISPKHFKGVKKYLQNRP